MFKISNHDNVALADSADPQPVYFVPSAFKLVIMILFTGGLYQAFWFYKNWGAIKDSGKKCNPLRRTYCSPLTAYGCFWYIRDTMIKKNIIRTFPIVVLAIGYFIGMFLIALPGFSKIFCAVLICVPLLIANQAALAANKAQFSDFRSIKKFSKWDWTLIALYVLIVILYQQLSVSKSGLIQWVFQNI